MLEFTQNRWLFVMVVILVMMPVLLVVVVNYAPEIRDPVEGFVSVVLLANAMFFVVVTTFVFSECLTHKKQQFNLTGVFFGVTIVGGLLGLLTWTEPFWVYLAVWLFLAIMAPCLYVRFGTRVTSNGHAVARGAMVTLMMTYSGSLILVAWLGVSNFLFGTIGPVASWSGLLESPMAAIGVMAIASLLGFPIMVMGIIALLSSVYGFTQLQDDLVEDLLAKRKEQYEKKPVSVSVSNGRIGKP